MPLYVPDQLPALETASSEGLPVLGGEPKEARPLRILLLNLMPDRPTTELDFIRVLASSELSVQLILMKIAGQSYHHTPQEHMDRFYTDFEQLKDGHYDGFIVTGTPVEHLPFEEVNYWPQLEEIFTWTRSHVRSGLYICWGSQAGLYFHYDIPKHPIPEKMFGIYEQNILHPQEPIFNKMGSSLRMPQSRHTEVRRADIDPVAELTVIAESPVSGVAIVKDKERADFFVTGHLEYAANTLEKEYLRDLHKGLPIHKPVHYYPDDDASKEPSFSWREDAYRFYQNWLEFYAKPSTIETT